MTLQHTASASTEAPIMKHNLHFHHLNEESFDILLDGVEIGSANHDNDGWAGMQAIKDVVTAMAHRLGVEVTEGYAVDEE